MLVHSASVFLLNRCCRNITGLGKLLGARRLSPGDLRARFLLGLNLRFTHGRRFIGIAVASLICVKPTLGGGYRTTDWRQSNASVIVRGFLRRR